MKRTFVVAALLATLTAVLGGCNDKPQTLYQRLGETAGITAVIDSFIPVVAGDAVINAQFAGTIAGGRIPALKQHLVEQICMATGGPCAYTGKSMPQAHAGMSITNTQFDALVGDLVTAMNRNHVGSTKQSELLAILGPLRSDIVGK